MSELNDPRVLFAAERTLLAWNRTSITLMAFGFLLERFGLFVHMLRQSPGQPGRDLSFWLGVAFIALALALIGFSTLQYRRVLASLKPSEIPGHYNVRTGITLNLAILLLGIALLVYLFCEL